MLPGRGLDSARGIVHFLAQPPQFVELHFAVDVAFDVSDIALQAADEVADGARDLWKLFRPDDDERNSAHHHELGETEIKHAALPETAIRCWICFFRELERQSCHPGHAWPRPGLPQPRLRRPSCPS